MEEIHKLRAQISYIVQANFSAVEAEFNSKLPPPSGIQVSKRLFCEHDFRGTEVNIRS